jgi:hypothetical protein
MKHLLLLLIAVPIHAAAQYQLGLNAGMYTTSESQHGIYASVRGAVDRKDFVLGAAIDYSHVWGFWFLRSKDRISPRIYHTYSIVSPNVFANYKMALPRGYAYLGATVGYFYTNMGDTLVTTPLRDGTVLTMKHSSVHTVAAGVQLGATIPLNKRLSINAEAAARKTSAHGQGFIYFPLSLGFRYSFGGGSIVDDMSITPVPAPEDQTTE